MCGIVGILGKNEVSPLILESLKRLEYRGYDSAGIATVNLGKLDRRRSVGKLLNHEGIAGSPLLLIAVLLIVLGVQIIGFGLVGEIIIFSQARNLKEYRIERIWE